MTNTYLYIWRTILVGQHFITTLFCDTFYLKIPASGILDIAFGHTMISMIFRLIAQPCLVETIYMHLQGMDLTVFPTERPC